MSGTRFSPQRRRLVRITRKRGPSAPAMTRSSPPSMPSHGATTRWRPGWRQRHRSAWPAPTFPRPLPSPASWAAFSADEGNADERGRRDGRVSRRPIARHGAMPVRRRQTNPGAPQTPWTAWCGLPPLCFAGSRHANPARVMPGCRTPAYCPATTTPPQRPSSRAPWRPLARAWRCRRRSSRGVGPGFPRYARRAAANAAHRPGCPTA